MNPQRFSRRRLPLVLALMSVPLSVAAFVNGCGSGEAPVENLCGWLADPDNCYREFYRDIGSTCGTSGRGSAKIGGFSARDKLDICVLTEGGQIIFDPPLDVGTFPLTTAGFKFLDEQGLSCGAGSFSGTYLFSMSVDSNVPDGGVDDDLTVAGGSFSVVSEDGRESFDTTCPSGEAHHFDRFEVAKCRQYEQLLPNAELESSAGGIDIQGYVRFRVLYPPKTGELSDAQPDVVEYFDCTIPGAPKTCFNGAQDGAETDEDCGGASADCVRCEKGQKCNEDSDCASNDCALESGFKKCQEAVASGAGGSSAATTSGAGGAGGGSGGAGGSGGS